MATPKSPLYGVFDTETDAPRLVMQLHDEIRWELPTEAVGHNSAYDLATIMRLFEPRPQMPDTLLFPLRTWDRFEDRLRTAVRRECPQALLRIIQLSWDPSRVIVVVTALDTSDMYADYLKLVESVIRKNDPDNVVANVTTGPVWQDVDGKLMPLRLMPEHDLEELFGALERTAIDLANTTPSGKGSRKRLRGRARVNGKWLAKVNAEFTRRKS